MGGTATRIPVYDGLVGQVSLSPFSKENGDKVTRVEVTTSKEVDFEIVESVDGLANALLTTIVGLPLGVLAYALWPGNRKKFDDAARIPLKED